MTWMEFAWLVPLLPLLAAGAIFLGGRLLPWRGAGIGIAAVGASLLISLGIGWHSLVDSPVEPLEHAFAWSPLGGGFTLELGMLVDGLTAMMFVLVTLVSLMVQIYSREYMEDEPRFTYFFGMLSLFTFSMLLLVIANNTLQALVGWELVGVCSYLLIGFYWEDKHNQDCANKAFLTTKLADVGLVVGVIVLSAGVMAASRTATPFNIPDTIELATAGGLSQATIVLGCLMIFLGAVGKSGQMPLHVWLPDAMAGPTPVSALIHAATMVTAGVFIVARLYPIFAQSLVVMNTVAVVGTITLLFAGFLALVQDDIKRVLAYSTVSQLGYMMAALGVGGYTAGIFHLFTHGFFKSLLFLGSGSLIHAVHSNDMSDMGGMRRYMPVTFATFIIGSLALAGFPLTAGFFSKDEVLVSGELWAAQGFVTGDLVFWVGLAGAFVTTFYMARACLLIFWGENRSHGTPHESGLPIRTALTVLATLSIVGGLIGSPWAPAETNFEQWTATPVLEETTYPFLAAGPEEGEGGAEDGAEEEAAGGAPRVVAASAATTGEIPPAQAGSQGVSPGEIPPAQAGSEGVSPVAAEGGQPEGHATESAEVLHGPPHFDVPLTLATLALFLVAVALAWRLYGRGLPDRDPMFQLGPVSTALVNKYWFDALGYAAVVVPVRDHLSRAADWSNEQVLDAAVRGVGGLVRRAGATTYDTLDQRVIDGGINGAAFSAGWWSDRLKRIQSGDVQRYAGALITGVIVLVLVFASAQ